MPQTLSVLQLTSLPAAIVEYAEDLEKENNSNPSYETIGGILFDTKYAWTANGPRFTLFNAKTGSKVAAWTFGSIVRDSATKVVCVDELRRLTGKLPLLVIGLECALTGGMICVFDIAGSRVLRSIQLRDKVTTLHVIDASYDQCPLPGPLRAFDGILSVGTADGNVLLLDICRQTCEEAVSGLGLGDIRDEVNFCHVKMIFLGDIYSVELHKQLAIKNGEHLCIHLNATNSASEHFVLKGPKGEDRVYVNKVEVLISALHYCPQLGSLLVGYNFGAWQLWNLINLQLMYTSPIYEENVPVSHFAVQEPCDDPRAFCYVWAVYSNTDPYETGFPVAVLYSLNYDTKEWHEGYGILYQDLTSCAVRFQTDLTLLGKEESENKAMQQGAHCVRLQAINKSVAKGSLHEHQEETLSLCSIVWSGWSSDSKSGPRTYMSVFDLNQWYKEQMPSSPRPEEYETYMTRVCLSDLLHAVNQERAPFLDVRIDTNTISQFFGSQRLEEHYYPGSLAFQLCGLRKCDIALFSNQGSQRALLANLELGGPLALTKPTELYHLAITLGLSPLFIDIPAKASPSIDYQIEFLLSIALEQQLLGWLCRCASAWSNGSYSAAGCTLHLLLTWGWQRAQVLKQNADKLFTPLFDYSGLRLDANTHNLLSNCARQLKNLTTLFEFVVQRFSRYLLNLDIVKKQMESLQMVSIHLEVLQWLLNVGLLPECSLSSYPRADEFNRISAPYPVDSLIEYYNQRRTCLQTLNAEQFSTSGSLLFIDNLIDVEYGGYKLQKEWQRDGGTGLYPPPSLQALLRTYLIENVDISFKHCVTVYVFLDLAMTLDQNRYKSTITHLIKFPAVFRLSPSTIKITQAFWQLDHGDFGTAMEQLLDPLVSTDDLKIWHHRVALKALLMQEQHNFALLYLQVRRPAVTEVQDLCTVLSLYVANGMLDEAFHFQRQNKSEDSELKLLYHFYKECDRKGEISSMLYLPLTVPEENAFIKYLKDVKHPQLKDLQILYYIQNSRYMDAFEINNSLSTIKVKNKGLQGQQKVDFRDFIVNGLTDALPKVSKSLMDACWTEKKNSWKEVSRPEPFSVVVHNASEQVKYKSTVIHAGLLKAKEIWTHPILNSTSVGKTNASVIMTSEEMPFMNTPKAKRVLSRNATPVIYPKITKLELSESDDGPSPVKRFKPSPRAPLVSPESHKSFRIETINKDITCTSLSIRLDTPIINRRAPKTSSILRSPEETFSVGTPQSILKIRNLVRNSESPDSAIDTSTSENVNVAPKSNRKLVYAPDTSTNISVRKSSLGVSPRKPLVRTPRPVVRFDISRTPSDTSLASTCSEPGYEVIKEQAVIHSHRERVEKLPNLTTSQQSMEAGTNSLSTEEVFFTPDTSDSNVESKEMSQIESDQQKVLHQQVSNAIMTRGRKSLLGSEPKSRTSRGTYKRQLEEADSTKPIEEKVEVTDVGSPLITKTRQDSPTVCKTPRGRRSYKGYLQPEQGVRSSPRLRKSLLTTETQPLGSVERNLELELIDFANPQQEDSSEVKVKETSILESTATVSSSSQVKSPARTSVKGRRSLSRQVREDNAFSKTLESEPLPMHIKSDISQLEVSYSKTETTYKSESTDEITKESLKVTLEEHKDVFTKIKDPDTSEQLIKHTHEESNTTSLETLTEEGYEPTSVSTKVDEKHLHKVSNITRRDDVEEAYKPTDVSTNVNEPSKSQKHHHKLSSILRRDDVEEAYEPPSVPTKVDESNKSQKQLNEVSNISRRGDMKEAYIPTSVSIRVDESNKSQKQLHEVSNISRRDDVEEAYEPTGVSTKVGESNKSQKHHHEVSSISRRDNMEEAYKPTSVVDEPNKSQKHLHEVSNISRRDDVEEAYKPTSVSIKVDEPNKSQKHLHEVSNILRRDDMEEAYKPTSVSFKVDEPNKSQKHEASEISRRDDVEEAHKPTSVSIKVDEPNKSQKHEVSEISRRDDVEEAYKPTSVSIKDDEPNKSQKHLHEASKISRRDGVDKAYKPTSVSIKVDEPNKSRKHEASEISRRDDVEEAYEPQSTSGFDYSTASSNISPVDIAFVASKGTSRFEESSNKIDSVEISHGCGGKSLQASEVEDSISEDPANVAYVASEDTSRLETSCDKINSHAGSPTEFSCKSITVSEIEDSISDDPANMAYVAFVSTPDLEESSQKPVADVASSTEHSRAFETAVEDDEGVSDDPANIAYVASEDVSSSDDPDCISLDVEELEEGSLRVQQETVAQNEVSSCNVEEKPNDVNIRMEISNKSEANVENVESTTASDEQEKNVAIYDDLSNDNYGSADPEMNVFEISDDLELNQGMCATSKVDVLEIDSNYTTNDVEVFADKSDVFSNVVAVNESSLGQFEVTENDELNKTIRDLSDTSFETETEHAVETKDSDKNYLTENNIEIIELDSSSDTSEQLDSESLTSNSRLSQNSDDDAYGSDVMTDEYQSGSELSDVFDKLRSTNSAAILHQKVETLSDSDLSQDADSTSDDYGNESDSNDSDDEDSQDRYLEDIPEESLNVGHLDAIPEEAENSVNEKTEACISEIAADRISEVLLENVPSGVIPEEMLVISTTEVPEPVSDVPTETRLEPSSSHLEDAEQTMSQDKLLDTIPEGTLKVEIEHPQDAAGSGHLEVIEVPQIIADQENNKLETTPHVVKDEQHNTVQEETASPLMDSKQVLDLSSEMMVTVEDSSLQNTIVLQLMDKTDILDNTHYVKTAVNTPYKDILDESAETCSVEPSRNTNYLNKTDILDATMYKSNLFGEDDLRSSTPCALVSTRACFEKSENANPLDQADHIVNSKQETKGKGQLAHNNEETVLKSSTPARRSRRLSSLQHTSTPVLTPARRSSRRSASLSFAQKADIEEPSTSKEAAIASVSDLPSSASHRRRSNSMSAANKASVTLPTQRKRRSSVDSKQLPLRKRLVHNIEPDIQGGDEEDKVEGAPSTSTRRAASVTVTLPFNKNDSKLSKNEEQMNENKPAKRSTRTASNMSSKTESRTRQKQSLKPRKSKSTIIVAATKSKLEEYSTTRRLTRRQANLLERTLGAHVTLEVAPLCEHRESDSDGLEDEERGPDIDEMDPIHLLDKSDFKGHPDSDEEKIRHKSPSSSVPESPIGARLRSRSSMSNNSPKSETSTVHSFSETDSSKKQKLQSLKRPLIDPDASISSRTRQRSKSVDQSFSTAQVQDKGSPPKLRRTRRSSKDDNASDISQTRSLTDGKKVAPTRRRTRSTVDQPVESSPIRRSERHPRLVKSELPKIIEEQPGLTESGSSSSHATLKGGKKK